MSYTILSARNPKWANPEHTMIDLMVLFKEHESTYGELPFSASPDDVEEHGRVLFLNAKNGEYGPVADYKPTDGEMRGKVASLTNEATEKINTLQLEVNTLQDAVDLEMATPEEEARLPIAKSELTAWKRYRVLLSRVEAQPGFPTDIVWPVKPA